MLNSIFLPITFLLLDQLFGNYRFDDPAHQNDQRAHSLLNYLHPKSYTMEEKEINVLEVMLDNLIVNVFGHKDRLLAQTEVQDVKFKKIWKAYNRMGLYYPHYSEELLSAIYAKVKEAKSDAPFIEKYKQNSEELDGLLAQLKNQDNPIEILRQAEKIIVDLLIFLNFQWELWTAKLSPVVKKVKVVRDTEIALIADFSAKKTTLQDHPSWPSFSESFAWQQHQLAAEQLELFSKEKDIMDQMQLVADERERLLNISTELFLR